MAAISISRKRAILTLIFSLTLGILGPVTGRAQEDGEEEVNLIHWAYASLYGTGVYWVGDDAAVYVVRLKPILSHHFYTGSDGEKHRWTLRIRFPLTFGLYNFNRGDITGGIFPDRLRSLSLVPGLALHIPVTRIWTVTPFGHMGWGKDTSRGGDSAWIYWAGLKSRLAIHMGRSTLFLLNGMLWFGFTPQNTPAQTITAILSGLEFRFPMFKRVGTSEKYFLKMHILNTWYLEDLSFLLEPDSPPIEVGTEWDVGLAFGKLKRMKLWIFKVDRIGLAYRWGYHITGIRVFFNTVF
jgi:hypothetical protein